jgi:holliday junction DNA helicase RuvA
MIERLEGEFLEIGPGHVLMNLAGVGIRVSVPRTLIDRLGGAKRGILWTRLIVREGDPQLFGFLDPSERTCFDALLGVSGVGPRIALAILSSMEPERLALEAERGSTEQLVLVSGVGKKLAGRIVLELKGKLPVRGPAVGQDFPAGAPVGDLGTDAVRALGALGYPATESRDAVLRILRQHADAPPPLDELLRQALIGLNRTRA